MILDFAFKNAIQLLSPSGEGGKLSILIFHRVLPAPDPIFPDEVDAAFFDEILGWLKLWFNILPLDQAVLALENDNLPARAAAITFDDGYADNFNIALPILKRHGLPATFFIATGFLDGGRMWNDTIIESVRCCSQSILYLDELGLGIYKIVTSAEKREAISSIIEKIKYRPTEDRISLTEQIAGIADVRPPCNLMMTSKQIKEMSLQGMQIGAHTVSHPILATTSRDIAKDEILQSKAFLEELLGQPVNFFAYPNGKLGQDYNLEHAKIIQELGFSAAVSTNWGVASKDSDYFQLPRFTPWDRNHLKFGTRLVHNLIKDK